MFTKSACRCRLSLLVIGIICLAACSTDPNRRKLGYVESASQIDAKKFPQFVPGSSCENCLQLQGKPGNNYRPCSLFPGKLVSVSGWCSAWTAEM